MESPAASVTRSRKRKASTDKPSDARADRKRVQNRISQQCLREKQLAHTRQLESFLEIIKTSNDETKNNEDRYSTLLDAHLKLIEEKRQLEDALFRLRKRLLSLSNIASTAADDEIFTQLLDKDGRRRRNGDSESPSQAANLPVTTTEQQHTQTPQSGPRKELDTIEEHPAEVMAESPSGPSPAGSLQTQPHQPSNDGILDTVSVFDPETITQTLTHDDGHLVHPIENEDIHFMSNSHIRFGPSMDTSPPPYMMYDQLPGPIPNMSFDNLKTIAITSATTFSDKMGNACRRYLAQVLGSGAVEAGHNGDESTALTTENMSVRLVRQLAATAVYLFSAFSGMEAYVYGVDAAPYMDRVMRWRISNTVANRLAVPEPFRPTPLQYNSLDHPIVIDFINWPTLRDQLIIHGHAIDYDTVIRDIVLNTVVEIEHRKIAINVYDIFHNRILSSSSRSSNGRKSSAVVCPEWKFIEVPHGDQVFGHDSDPVEDALVQEISWRMQFGMGGSGQQIDSLERLNPFAAHETDPSDGSFGLFPWSNPNFRKNEIATYFGIDRLSLWKLSPAFARKYPIFDCTAVVSQYEMVSCAAATVF
ncbi:hypothetical protein K432DRAFT_347304 [Lepidopterella palustris CBS 459.81]|uniref:BZIP domain-containing protein n=1 Tax=Lepidopterella palustris CBS 459.81 TaxID=1314670 RepID=A0A8E2JI17_9PEZI|nr:hypothetical protein K432DRAFT_347304 [Lepidopterella palustris CBS 459.81]